MSQVREKLPEVHIVHESDVYHGLCVPLAFNVCALHCEVFRAQLVPVPSPVVSHFSSEPEAGGETYR